MATTEDMEKRVKGLKQKLETALQGTEADPPDPERIRQIRKRLKRNQRKLRRMKASQAKAATRKKKEPAPSPS